MGNIWIMLGELEAPGWKTLREDYQNEKVEIIHLDPKVWAIVEADEPPGGYEGLRAEPPADGMYIDPNGTPLFLIGGRVAGSAEEVIAGLGGEAAEMLAATDSAETTLERLGKVY
jgi:hypothetical protein